MREWNEDALATWRAEKLARIRATLRAEYAETSLACGETVH
jgi:hypothetical protein